MLASGNKRSHACPRRPFVAEPGPLSNQSQRRTNESLGPLALQERKLENLELDWPTKLALFDPKMGISRRQRPSRHELTHGMSGLFRKASRRAKIRGLCGWAERIRPVACANRGRVNAAEFFVAEVQNVPGGLITIRHELFLQWLIVLDPT
jgi:hypothetical protein